MDNIYLLKQFPIPELLLTAQDSVYKKNALWKQSVQNYGYYNITKLGILSATIHIHQTLTVNNFNNIQNHEEKHAWNQLPIFYWYIRKIKSYIIHHNIIKIQQWLQAYLLFQY